MINFFFKQFSMIMITNKRKNISLKSVFGVNTQKVQTMEILEIF